MGETNENTKKGAIIFPCLLTTGGMFFGFYAIMAALTGSYQQGAMAILVAGVFDGLDGRVARAMNATSAFGKEYDSLADFLSFGIAPAVLIHQWALTPFARVGWAGAFLFAVCGALRLARFNVQKAAPIESVAKRYFQGLPIPAAAGVLAATVLFYVDLGIAPAAGRAEADIAEFWRWLPLVLVYALGILMVSGIRFRSFKEFNWHRRRPFLTLVAVVLFITVLTIHMEVTLFTVGWAYLLSSYSSHREYRRLLAQGQEEEEDEVKEFNETDEGEESGKSHA
ncbi:MAG: CDP-diacylglycerol--serine O-phosphatidyltransferase [Magnetococcales bacterium]|nr:CDP-diacylglycerol--serine O-phosphatidyltransferase [Magnetococcales bacterium]MBF0262046.1 CDP-diacylglycerol--serine O-phosphatidyltransferase [Magnetococcales bacterium]